MKDNFKNKEILVTGGTGTFGRLCIQTILKNTKAKRVVVFSRDELKQEEMRTIYGFTDKRLRYFIGDVRDKERLQRAFVGIDIVIHAAALKQVPSCEYNPLEAVKTNIGGAENIIDAAINAGVKNVVALSTDKAVNPINLYGATKLVAEKLFVQANNYSNINGTKFSCVRYGNVLGSRGSVLPLFQHQKEQGEITITDINMTRFWIQLDEGVRFVMKSVGRMSGGEIFVPKLSSMKVIDLANIIAPGCKIKKIGIRAGEKLHEILISDEECRRTYEFPDYFVIKPLNIFNKPENKLLSKSRLTKLPIYSSDTNSNWLTIKYMSKLVKTI